VRPRLFWPVTLAAAALVGLLAYGVFSKGADRTLDDALACRLQGQGGRLERLGLVVRPVP
jgi:hypothetical protein